MTTKREIAKTALIFLVLGVLILIAGCKSDLVPASVLIPTSAETPISLSTPTSAIPTYSQVLKTYPPNAELCQTVADIMGGGDNEGLNLSGRMETQNGQVVYQCYGTQITVKVEVILDGKTYEPGTLLTVDKDLHWIEVSSWK